MIAVILTVSMSLSTAMPVFANDNRAVDQLNLQYEGYMAIDGYHESGSYVIDNIQYEYEEFNTKDGKIYIDVYQVSNTRLANSPKIKTQEIYADISDQIMIINSEKMSLTVSSEIVPYGDIYTAEFTGNTLMIDITRYTVEAIALQLLSWSFSGWAAGAGIGIVLGVAVAIYEGFTETFYADYTHYVTTELFPLRYPGCSAVNEIYCAYTNHSTGASVGRSDTFIDLVI